MRTLLALTALMLVLAGAVWWKTRPAENANNMPATTSNDERLGIATVGMTKGNPAEASFPVRPATDGGGDHEDPNASVRTPGERDLPTQNPASVAPDPPRPALEPDANPGLSPPAALGVAYTVVSGDTFYSLVRRAYGSAPEELLDAVAAANGLDDPSALEVGQVLQLPVIDGFTAPQKP